MLDGRDCIVTGCALAVMAALNIWSSGWPKLFCILIGMVVGYFVAGAVGLLGLHDVVGLLHRPLFAAPSLARVSWRFEWSLAVPFAVTGIAAAMNTTAVVTTYQRLTDAEWVRPDMTSIGRGVFGDGIATTIAGLFGTYGVTVSSANVGLVAATGVASRVIGFAVAAILAFAALQPTLIGVLTIMPRPVMAAARARTRALARYWCRTSWSPVAFPSCRLRSRTLDIEHPVFQPSCSQKLVSQSAQPEALATARRSSGKNMCLVGSNRSASSNAPI